MKDLGLVASGLPVSSLIRPLPLSYLFLGGITEWDIGKEGPVGKACFLVHSCAYF